MIKRYGVGVGGQRGREGGVRLGWSMIRGAGWWRRGYAPREAPTPASLPDQAPHSIGLKPDEIPL